MSFSLRSDAMAGIVLRGMVLAVVFGMLLFYFLPPILARMFLRLGWL